MEELPPKTLKTQLVRLDHNLKQIERSHFAGIQRAPGSLPVLEAFQEFLDKERQKAHRRMVALTALFVVLLLAAAGAGTAVVYFQLQRMAVDYDSAVAETEALGRKLATEDEVTRSSLAALESQFGEDNRSSLARHEELLSAHATVAKQVAQGGEGLSAVQSVLDRLASENAALKADLDRVMKDWPAVAQQVRELQQLQKPPGNASVARKAPLPVSPPDVVAREEQVPEPPASKVTLTIVPAGEPHGIRWRLPAIPE